MEARRDRQGNLAVYRLPKNDGGGTFEVAGINDRFHPQTAKKLADLIKAKKFAEAEAEAIEYICQYTDPSVTHIKYPGVAYLLRDIAFNRGPGGAIVILRAALLGQPLPRVRQFPALTMIEFTAINQYDPVTAIEQITKLREDYEYKYVGRRKNLDQGLRNRWAKAREAALKFPTT
jgi:lysozyme family protein